MPRHMAGDPCDADLSLIQVYDHDTERMVWIRDPEWIVATSDGEDEDDGEGCDGDDLHADDRCDECGVMLATHGGLHGLCAECREDEDDEFTDDDEELI